MSTREASNDSISASDQDREMERGERQKEWEARGVKESETETSRSTRNIWGRLSASEQENESKE